MTDARMPALYVNAAGGLELRELPRPTPHTGQVLLRTLVSAVCGSDLHRFRGSDSYGFDTDVFGHESVGEVVTEGSGAFAVGQRVLHLPFPHEGRVFAPLQVARESQLIALPEGMPARVGVFAQQLGTVVHAMATYWPGPTPPGRVFVAGAGPAGLLFIQLAGLLGCSEVVVDEPVAHRRELAVRFGARVDDDASAADLSIDAAGTPEARASCVERVRPGGTLGMFGLPDEEPGDLGVTLLDLLNRELRIVGAKGAQTVPGIPSFHRAVELLRAGDIVVDPLISHEVTLAEMPDACRVATDLAADVVKVLCAFDRPVPE